MNNVPLWLQAAGWGGLAGSALVLGSIVALIADLPRRLIAAVMAFGAGVLISALSFELVEKAWLRDGFFSTASGFVGGALIFTAGNFLLTRVGAKHRKRAGYEIKAEGSSGFSLALGALLDGIPEGVVIGVSLLAGKGVSLVAVVAVFLSNVPEGLASATGMKNAGHRPAAILALWSAIALASAIASALGCLLLAPEQSTVIASIEAIAAGAILAMVVETMVPEAFAEAHDFSGLIAVLGFIAAFMLSKMEI